MDKSPDAFRTISEVAEWLGVQAHVLRFWESKFSQVKPVKRAGGRRYYRPADMLLLGGIKKLLHEDGMTVKGVQKTLREQGIGHVSDLSQELCEVSADTAQKMARKATILPFKGDPAADDVTETDVTPKPEPQPTSEPEVPSADTAPTSPEPAPEPEPEVEAAPITPVEEQPILPSFLHRPVKTATAEPAQESASELAAESTPEPVAEAKPSLVVDAPDPPNESDLPYTQGALARLSRIEILSADTAAKIAPLAMELQGWLDRQSGAGAR
jgi:DNA-binding transcriptional MerR regulator